MLLTRENKRALRRLKGERSFNTKELSDAIGIHYNTARKIVKREEAEEVRPTTYQKIMQFITENY